MLDVLYEDNHLLAVNKPAMLPTMGVAEDRPSLLTLAKEHLRRKYAKPGNVYLGIVSRLDAPVTGVVLMARTSKAAARLTAMFREREVEKIYWALVEGRVDPPSGQLTHYLRKDERHRQVHVTGQNASGAQRAELRYRVIRRGKNFVPGTLLEIQLLTGRKHQIRVQLADAGWPVIGDRKYGSVRKIAHGIALHSRRLAFEHPVRKELLTLEAPPPSAWLTRPKG
ncbi:MAG TPA: RluA family pseudouridine synthase [Lacipirellulaceae bacterium]|jgi:23S rRNA pseudouridine1911/1915/1917 synthase